MDKLFNTWGSGRPSDPPSPEALQRQEDSAALDRMIDLGCEAARADAIEAELLAHLKAKYGGVQLTREDDLKHDTLVRYADAFTEFCEYCEALSISPLPARSAFVADFLDEQIVRGASAGAIRLLSAAISFAHRINDHADPCVATVVKLVVRAAWLSRKKTKKGKDKWPNPPLKLCCPARSSPSVNAFRTLKAFMDISACSAVVNNLKSLSTSGS